MFGWVSNLAEAFATLGPWGVVLLALLIIILALIRQNSAQAKSLQQMHEGMIQALNRSSTAHQGVTRVLGRIEGVLGLPLEQEPD